MLFITRYKNWLMTYGIISLTIFLLWIACSQKNPIDPTSSLRENVPTLVNISSSISQIAVGGSQAEIRVQLVDKNGIPMTNEAIQFTTTLGTITPQDSTNAQGWAAAILVSGDNAGTATVTARYDEDTALTITVRFVAASNPFFMLDIQSSTLLANGIDKSTIIATVLTDSATPMAGVEVEFNTDIGTLSQAKQITDADGEAKVTLTSTASTTDLFGTVFASYDTLEGAKAIVFLGIFLVLGAEPDEILADGESTSDITAVLKETTTQIAVSNANVTFSTNKGLIPNSAYTDSRGLAEVTLTSAASDTGIARIIGRYGAALSDTIEVEFSLEAPSVNTLESVGVSPAVLFANGAEQTTVTAKVVDDNSDPVAGAVVLFSSTAGSIPVQGITNANGLANVTLTSGTSTTDITAWIRARLGTQVDSVSVLFLGIESQVTAFPTSITADGVSTSMIQVILKQTTNKVAVSGATLTFGTDHGTIPVSSITSNAGVAQCNLTSSISPATAHVEVRYGNMVLDTAEVIFVESVVSNLDVSAMPLTIPADGQSKSVITAVVSDANSIPVQGANIAFENVLLEGVNKGTLSPQSALTNANGIATSTLTGGTSPGKVRVYIRTGVLEDSVDVNFRVGDVDHIEVVSDLAVLPADGITQTTITATVLDANDNPVENIIVAFSSSIGDITPSGTTDADGMVTARFSSGTVGYATITASSGGKSGQTVIRLIPGLPNSIILSFDPPSIGVMGTGQNQTTHVIAEVRDSKNNTVLDSTMVTYSIVHGPGGGESLSSYSPIPTVGGISRVSLSSGTISGNVRVRAQVTSGLGGILAEASDILIHAGPAYMEDRNNYASTHLTVRAADYNIWRSLGTTELEIAVFDKYHNPVQNGTAVYLTASGGGVSTHSALTNEFGKASVILTGANPQPLIYKYYYGELMADPNNSSIVLPGPVYYSALGEWLLPDFENGLVANTMEDSIATCPRYGGPDASYVHLENDGVARVIAYTEGKDAAGDSIRVWDQIAVVYSGPVSYDDDSETTLLGDTLHLGEYRTVIFSLMDDKGNPIESNSTISASIMPAEAPAAISWTELNTGSGWGTVYYAITISNAIDEEKPKPGVAIIKIQWNSEHQFGTASTYPVFMDL